MVPSCAAPAAANSTAALGRLLGTSESNGLNFGAEVQCTAQQAAFAGDDAAINRQLYCGFYQVHTPKPGAGLQSIEITVLWVAWFVHLQPNARISRHHCRLRAHAALRNP